VHLSANSNVCQQKCIGETELLLNASRDLGASRAFKKPLDAKTILEAVKELAG